MLEISWYSLEALQAGKSLSMEGRSNLPGWPGQLSEELALDEQDCTSASLGGATDSRAIGPKVNVGRFEGGKGLQGRKVALDGWVSPFSADEEVRAESDSGGVSPGRRSQG